MFSKPKKQDTAAAIERPGFALLQDVPNYTEAGKRVTASRLEEIARVMPGATEQRQLVSDIILADLRGEKTKDVEQQTMRGIAEYAGAGFNPATAGRAGGFQISQGFVPRQFGELTSNIQQRGMSAAMSWQQLADLFTYDPFEASQFAGLSQKYGESRSAAQARDEATYQQAVANQQKAIVGGITGLASIALAPIAAPMLMGGLASGAAGLGLGSMGTASTLGTGLAGSFQNAALGRVGTGLAGGAAMPAGGWFKSPY